MNINGISPIRPVHALVDSNKRELLPLLLLVRHLHTAGVSAELETISLASTPRGLARDGGRRVRLLPFYYNDWSAQKNLSRARWTGEVLINLCWEQIRNDWLEEATLPVGKLPNQGLTFLSWGQRHIDRLLGHGIAASQMVRTGNMRFDLPHHPELLKSRAELARRYGLREERPWLLIPWNLQFAVPDSPALHKVCGDFGVSYPAEIEEVALATKERFMALLEKLPAELSGWEIIFRAHPTDRDTAQLKQLLAGSHAPIHFIPDYDLAAWYTNCQFVLGWTSTSLVESAAYGVPSLSFEPEDYSDRFNYDVGRMVRRVQREGDVFEAITNAARHTTITDPQLFAAWYGDNDGNAAASTAQVVLEALEGSRGAPSEAGVYACSINPLRNVIRRMVSRRNDNGGLLGKLAHGRKQHKGVWIPPALTQAAAEGRSLEAFDNLLRG